MFRQRYFKLTKYFLQQTINTYRYNSVRIGCASGFWGDTNVAAPQLIRNGDLNYLVFDYLSEITMSLLVMARTRDSTKGYTPDFLSIARYAKEIKEKNIKVIANAGGINPKGCSEELMKLLDKTGVELKVAVVSGDDISQSTEILKKLEPQTDETRKFLSASVYLGAQPIKTALDGGADVVITGRCVDSALALGPLMHHFNWMDNEYDKLAAGSLAGHLIECGAQVTGGIFTDYDHVPDWWNIGFPIVEVESDGQFSVTKPPGTGGLVSTATVAEQLVYEIGDPQAYELPDVCCDFSQVSLTQIAENRVHVEGATGKNPSDKYKISATYLDNYRLNAIAIIVGTDAAKKAYRTAEQILKRVRTILKQMKLKDFNRTKVQVIGADDSYGDHRRPEISQSLREATLWIAAEHQEQKPLQVLASEIAPAGTGMSPGLTQLIGGRPRVTPMIKLQSCFIDKHEIEATVSMTGYSDTVVKTTASVTIPEAVVRSPGTDSSSKESVPMTAPGGKKIRLGELAMARSGDKGNNCNIGVIARSPRNWDILREHLTDAVVADYFRHFLTESGSTVYRYELPGIMALNFVLENSLGGGGMSSLNIDPQGKGYAQMLLDLEIYI